MDKSVKYIEMCKEAYEIQWRKVPLWGFCNFELYDIFQRGNKTYHYVSKEDDQPRVTGTTWLLRQDQLQDIYKDSIPESDILGKKMTILHLSKFYEFVNENIYYQDISNSKDVVKFNSFEQYWLAFVMYKVYEKKWDVDLKKWTPFIVICVL